MGGRVSLDVQYDLRNAIYDQLQRLDFARHDEMQTGQLVSRANSDVGLLQGLLAFLPIMSGNVLLLVLSIVIMFVLSPLLALVVAGVVPALASDRLPHAGADLPRQLGRPAARGRGRGRRRGGRHRSPGGQGVRTGGAGAAAPRRAGRGAVRLPARAVRLQARYQPVLQAIPVLGEVAVLALGGWLALHNEITLGYVSRLRHLPAAAGRPARMLAGVLIVAQQARAGTERVLDLLASNPIVTGWPRRRGAPPGTGPHHLRRCSFRVSEQPAGAGRFRSRR